LKRFRAELHTHTVLSPCGAIEMIPPLIVQEAIDRGINLLAITDHNATGNILSVQKASIETGLVVLAGIELQTREEVHVLCLFDTYEQILEIQSIVDNNLPNIKNIPDFFGEQFFVDETGDYIRSEERLLANSVNITLKEAGDIVASLGGLFIPAHINRQAFGLIANLGLVPTDVKIDALEISRHISPLDAQKSYPQINYYPLVQNGDVHQLDDFLGANEFEIEKPTIQELRMAILGQEKRSHQILSPV
jgi:PHP family Zn ribbon phosphoesterase